MVLKISWWWRASIAAGHEPWSRPDTAIPTSIEMEAYNAVETYRLNRKGAGEHSIWGMRFIWPFKSEFLITYLDENYSQTIISRNKRDFAWIMGRSPEIPEADYQKLLLELTAQGYDLTKLRKVPQRWPQRP